MEGHKIHLCTFVEQLVRLHFCLCARRNIPRITVFKDQPSAKQAAMWHSSSQHVHSYQHTRCTTAPGTHAGLPPVTSMSSEHYFPPHTGTSRRFDKWQVVLKRLLVHRHAKPPSDTLLQFGAGMEGREGNAEGGAVRRLPEHERDGETRTTQRST